MSIEAGERPKVSVGLPVYNGADYVGDAIASILAQTLTDFELVICDNASTDGTEEICRSYAAKDSRIIYYRHPENLGASANFDKVFELSSGRYFRWHGHDDMIAPEFLEKLVAVLDEDPGCVLVYPRAVMIDELAEEKWCFLEYMACPSEDPAERLNAFMGHARDDYTNPVFGLMPSEVVAKTELIRPYLASDRVFLAHIAMMGRCREIPDLLFLRREHKKMSTAAHKNKRDLRAWYDRKRPLLMFKTWRLIREYLKVINMTSMDFSARLRCYGVFLKWVWSRRVRLIAELMLPLMINGRPTALGRFTIRMLGIKVPGG